MNVRLHLLAASSAAQARHVRPCLLAWDQQGNQQKKKRETHGTSVFHGEIPSTQQFGSTKSSPLPRGRRPLRRFGCVAGARPTGPALFSGCFGLPALGLHAQRVAGGMPTHVQQRQDPTSADPR